MGYVPAVKLSLLSGWRSEGSSGELVVQHVERVAVLVDPLQLVNDAVEQRFFFDLFIDEPLQEVDRRVLAIVHREVGQLVEAFRILLLMFVALLEGMQHGVVVIVRFRQRIKGRSAAAVVQELINFHGVKPFFFRLYDEEISETVQAVAGAVRSHRKIHVCGVELEVHLFV
jgi:hypothetical protein